MIGCRWIERYRRKVAAGGVGGYSFGVCKRQYIGGRNNARDKRRKKEHSGIMGRGKHIGDACTRFLAVRGDVGFGDVYIYCIYGCL